jgi:hypothetical protein
MSVDDRNLETQELRDHLQMVDRILARADATPCISGWPFIVWGVVAGAMNVVSQLVVVQGGSPSLYWVAGALLLIAVLSMVTFGRKMKSRERRGLLDGHISNIFMIAWIVAMVSTLGASHIFAAWGQAGIWSLMFGVATMYVALLSRSRAVFVGGVILILSILAANLELHYAGFVLAAGDFIGMGGAGIALTIARRSSDG